MKTQREIADQRYKNKCVLKDYIEKISGEPINSENANRLAAYRGAYKAICMIDNDHEKDEEYVVYSGAESRESSKHTPELDGDTEFEQFLMSIPVDVEHVSPIFRVMANFMYQLQTVNRGSYDALFKKFKGAYKH